MLGVSEATKKEAKKHDIRLTYTGKDGKTKKFSEPTLQTMITASKAKKAEMKKAASPESATTITAPVVFEGRKEALKIVDTGGNLVRYLTRNNPICPLIGSKIKLGEQLGEGEGGAAFLVEIEGIGTRQYVVKKSLAEMDAERVYMFAGGKKEITLSDLADQVAKKTSLLPEAIIASNGGDPSRVLVHWDYVNIPVFLKLCRTEKTLEFPRARDRMFDSTGGEIPNEDVVVFPSGSYLCSAEVYSEYINSVLAGQLIANRISANFFSIFEFATCRVGTEYNQYTFMEKIDTSLESALSDIFMENPPYVSSSIVVQILHAIATYQHYYQLSHNDLHTGNVFIEYVRPDTVFNGQTLSDADHFHYHIGGVDLYVPASKYIVKIGDWGLSVKYSTPIVGNLHAIETGYDQGNGIKWIPNWFAANYDSMFAIQSIRYGIMEKYKIRSTFIERIWAAALNLPYEPFDLKQIDIATMNALNYNNRVKVQRLKRFPNGSPVNILTNPRLMGDFMMKPTEGKIVTLGVLE